MATPKKVMSICTFVHVVTSSNLIFGVTFVKKGNGEVRKMQARMHVSKGVKGVLPEGQRKAEDKANNVLTVYDMQKLTESGKGAFRRINLEQLLACKVQGVEYNWDKNLEMLIEA